MSGLTQNVIEEKKQALLNDVQEVQKTLQALDQLQYSLHQILLIALDILQIKCEWFYFENTFC